MSRRRYAFIALAFALVLLAPIVAHAQPADIVAPVVSQPEESFIRWMIRASGPIGLVILAMSFYLIALVAWMSFEYRHSVAIPDALVRDLSDLIERKKFTEAFQRLELDASFLSRVVSAGVRKLSSGLGPAQRAMEMANEDVSMAMEHRTTYLSTVGTLGPMIGLVGTVYGMILSFRVIATSGGSPQASALAGGISTALFATLEGIAISVPAIAFYAFFRNRIARLSLEVAMISETFLEGFARGQRASHPLVSTPAPIPQRSALPPKGD